MIKYKWIGKTGTNKKFGYVKENEIPENISDSDIEFGLEHGLLELVEEEEKKTKKAIKIKED